MEIVRKQSASSEEEKVCTKERRIDWADLCEREEDSRCRRRVAERLKHAWIRAGPGEVIVEGIVQK